MRYLARHEAVHHAPAILERFRRSKGMVAGNCASTLAKMHYEPAMDVMLEHFVDAGSEGTFLGILDYLGEIQFENSRDALKSAVNQINNPFLMGSAMTNLLHHHESADEIILSAIKNREIGDWQSFAILEHLPYAEAYDLALHRWDSDSDNEMDSYEIFASCLRGIGDPRGIEKLQDIYANENDASYIGDSLECLSKIHGVDR